MTRDEAWNLANHWVAAWNGHDLDLIMIHYDDAIELTSPVAAQLLGTSDGKVVGKANLRITCQRGTWKPTRSSTFKFFIRKSFALP